MQSLEYVIKTKLEQVYHIPIEVVVEKSEEKYRIKLIDADNRRFQTLITIKNNIRLTIEVIPEKYSAHFIEELGAASLEKKTSFINVLLYLKTFDPKINLLINDNEVSASDFLGLVERWKKFSFRFSLSPYFDQEKTNGTDEIAFFTSLIFGLILELANIKYLGHEEGEKRTIQTTKYERSRVNREICLKEKGYRCIICKILLSDIYGKIAEGFIEVHHVTPLSKIGHDYLLDPINDLIPVCPNCHSIIHRRDPIFSLGEMFNFLEDSKKQS